MEQALVITQLGQHRDRREEPDHRPDPLRLLAGKNLTVEDVQASDVVITMGRGDTCPAFPGKTYLDWRLDDPAGRGVDAVRLIRDEIEDRVRGPLADLGVDPSS